MENQSIIEQILSVLNLDELSKSKLNQELASSLIDQIEEDDLDQPITLQ